MKKTALALTVALLCPLTASAQIVISIGDPSVRAADDFATRAFQDPWDMSQRTDLGWFLNGVDQPTPNMTNIQFSGGIFSGVSDATGDANVFLLDSGNPFAARLGKTGSNFPIDANTFKILALRMSLSSAFAQAQIFWNRDTIYDNTLTVTTYPPNAFLGSGFRIHLIDLSTATATKLGEAGFNWGGTVQTLRLDPSNLPNDTFQLDWARLVDVDQTLCRTIVWDSSATVDIYLDDDASAGNGNLGPIALGVNGTANNANSASPGCPRSGSGYKYYAGALAPGTYRVVVVNSGFTPAAGNYSSTSWVVNDIPTLSFISPSEEGSSDDFATTVLGNPWDMDSTTDVDRTLFLTNARIDSSLHLETEAGVDLGFPPVYRATSTDVSDGAICGAGGACGDPQVQLLWKPGRGVTSRIDTTKYRILTFEMGIPNLARNIFNRAPGVQPGPGGIGNVVWEVGGNDAPDASGETVGLDIIMNSRAGGNVVNKFILDMADRSVMPIKQGSTDGWIQGSSATPGVDHFRIDPHEYAPATDFFIKRVKLAALERTAGSNNTYTIKWAYSDSSNSGTVDLFWDTDNSGFEGDHLIISGLNAADGATGFTWNTTGISQPSVFIYAVFRDTFAGGANTNQVYAKWPILLAQNTPPTVSLNRAVLNYGVTTVPTKTSTQTVRVNIAGTGSPQWCVTNPLPAIFSVSPTSGSGNGAFTVSLIDQVFGGNQTATLAVGACNGSAIANSATVRAVLRVLPFGNVPNGAVDTPAEGATVSGSIAVTGWVVDDIDISSVAVFRDPVAGETGSRIFIGNATRVDDARPDIEGFNPDVPFQYRGGWGYLLLTNFLPNQGTGNFRLLAYAIDKEGHETLLGTRNIIGANSSSFVPFGAIDTPDQGATVSGTTPNFGWVLVRGSARANGAEGGTVTVFVDGVTIGSPSGWTSRPDLTALFPATTFFGIARALGVFNLNTASYTNGVHTIFWIVTATNGKADGIGSRFFTIANGSSLTLASAGGLPAPHSRLAGQDVGRRSVQIGPADRTSPIRAQVGYTPASLRVRPDALGLRTITTEPLGRVVVDAAVEPGHSYDAYWLVNDVARPLPVGATFDSRRGVLYWQPTIGFTGAYDFVIVRDGYLRTPVRIVISGAGGTRLAPRTPYSNLFRSGLE